jgi:hypothetical protein
MRRIAILAVTISLVAASAQASWTIAPPGTERSKEIHAMNILDRPNRPLHFYGDTVRWAHRRSEKRG